MDALTSFELEAQRRRETVASDRDLMWARVEASIEPVEARIVASRLPSPRVAQADCEPKLLARQAIG